MLGTLVTMFLVLLVQVAIVSAVVMLGWRVVAEGVDLLRYWWRVVAESINLLRYWWWKWKW